jgi:hypothetical protein
MSKQTALQWFMDKLPHSIETQFSKQIQQALEMEQEQIEKSYTSGREQWQKYEWDNSNYENDIEIPTPRKYYNETYGGEK